ncbi:HK97 gp10 family phage protein [Paenibacillus naphthalenovorans]|uniref:HK97 gp10 family phage protein n=1 Tax=Paenibacillus naphthalenovorans TaxID=162209 RepID=UPI003D28AC8D
MPKWGKFDFSEFEQLAKTFKKALDERVIERFIKDFLLEMAFRAERKIKKRTPVDTGELRRNWQVGRVERRGDAYQVEIWNNTEYAPYVEYGHRTGADLTKWVEGRFMMTISMQEIERELPRYLEKRMTQLLNDIMNGRPPKKE